MVVAVALILTVGSPKVANLAAENRVAENLRVVVDVSLDLIESNRAGRREPTRRPRDEEGTVLRHEASPVRLQPEPFARSSRSLF